MTKRFPTDYPVLNPLAPALVILGDDGVQTGYVSIAALLAALGVVGPLTFSTWLASLPTADPHVANQGWNNDGFLCISGG